MAVEPFHYYRLTFSSKTESPGYWAVAFFDDQGQELAADLYDGVDASKDWQSATFCFRAHALAKRIRVRFQPIAGELFVKDVLVEQASAADVAAWADQVAAGNPPLRYEAPAKRCERLPKTMKVLQEGGNLRVVMLGDSICNDTSNSLYETLLMRAHPKTQMQVVTSVRGGTGCQYYAENNRIKDYVLRFNPDLVIIAGVSHGYDVEAMRRVVRQIKRSASCEIMVLSGALAPEEVCRQRYLAAAKLPAAPVPENVAQFLPRLRRMTDEENVEFLDMRSAWDQYLHGSPRPIEWFHRDAIHGNTRGKQVVGRILARYLDPAQE